MSNQKSWAQLLIRAATQMERYLELSQELDNFEGIWVETAGSAVREALKENGLAIASGEIAIRDVLDRGLRALEELAAEADRQVRERNGR